MLSPVGNLTFMSRINSILSWFCDVLFVFGSRTGKEYFGCFIIVYRYGVLVVVSLSRFEVDIYLTTKET